MFSIGFVPPKLSESTERRLTSQKILQQFLEKSIHSLKNRVGLMQKSKSNITRNKYQKFMSQPGLNFTLQSKVHCPHSGPILSD